MKKLMIWPMYFYILMRSGLVYHTDGIQGIVVV